MDLKQVWNACRVIAAKSNSVLEILNTTMGDLPIKAFQYKMPNQNIVQDIFLKQGDNLQFLKRTIYIFKPNARESKVLLRSKTILNLPKLYPTKTMAV